MITRILWSTAAIVIAIAVVIGYQKRGELFLRLYEHQRESSAAPATPMPPALSLAIVNVNLIPMTSEVVLRDHTVLIEDGVVRAVGPAPDLHVGPDYQVVDGRGRYLMPGLADMHVHISGDAFAPLLFIVNGVTAVREMNGDAAVLAWASDAATGKILAPRIYTTGPILDGRPNEHAGRPVTTPEVARARVKQQHADGFRMVKPYTWLDREVYLAVVKTAKSLGMYVVGHVPYSVGAQGAIAAGQDEIAHIHSFHQDFFVDFDSRDVFREYAVDHLQISRIAALVSNAGVRVTTTLIVNQALADAQDLDAFLGRPMQDYEFSWARFYMNSPSWRFNKLWAHEYLQETYLPWVYALLKNLHDAGVMLVLGTDSGVTGLVHGFSTHEELRLLVRAGLTSYEALQAATVNAAHAVGEQDRWGTIEAGKFADLVMLNENPLDDVGNSTSIAGVVKSGRWFDQTDLSRLKAQIRTAMN